MTSHAQLGCLAASLLHFGARSLSSNRQGRIKLADDNAASGDADGGLPSFAASARAGPALAFEPSGDPVEPAKFWKAVTKKKLALLGCNAAVLGLSCFRLGWNVAQLEFDQHHSAKQLLMYLKSDLADALLWAYITILSTVYIKARSKHWPLTLHLTALSFLALISFAFTYAPASVINPKYVRGTSHDPLTWRITAVQTALSAVIFFGSGTIPKGPPLMLLRKKLAAPIDQPWEDPTGPNVSSLAQDSALGQLFFSWTTRLLDFGATKSQLDEGDLPFLPADLRSSNVFLKIKVQPESRSLALRLLSANAWNLTVSSTLSAVVAALYYAPALFLNLLVTYLEKDPENRPPQAVGFAYAVGLFVVLAADAILEGQLWLLASGFLASKVRMQLNTLVFEKVLRRKDFTGASRSSEDDDDDVDDQAAAVTPAQKANGKTPPKEDEEEEVDEEDQNFTSKNQCMTVFSVDVDRVAQFADFGLTLVDAPLELLVGCYFLYRLLGSAGLLGIATSILFLPLNHFASMAFSTTQTRLMNARDRRVSLMSEVLSSIRMIKFMAWERPFEARINAARETELRAQKQQFALEVVFELLWNISPVTCSLTAFFLYTKVQGHELTPATAFASLAVFNELRFALNALPDVFVTGLESLVSLRRIERFLAQPEIQLPGPSQSSTPTVAFRNATLRWPVASSPSATPSDERTPQTGASTPYGTFALRDITIDFVPGKLNLICGPLGSGKSLLIQSLLGETDLLAGQVVCPRTPANSLFTFAEDHSFLTKENWVIAGQCGYVPQAAWLQNSSIRSNILFGLPMDPERYEATLECCSLTRDLKALDDGDSTEIGERGIGLSGGQKHRVSLARAVYSRAGILLLDDVLSAVDAHTSQHIYTQCFLGPLMQDRTIILVSHHTQLVLPGSEHITLLENGFIKYSGHSNDFLKTDIAPQYFTTETQEGEEGQPRQSLSRKPTSTGKPVNKTIQRVQTTHTGDSSDSSEPSSEESESESDDEEGSPLMKSKKARKQVLQEKRAVGTISSDVWSTYLKAAGPYSYWFTFAACFVGAAVSYAIEGAWLARWSRSYGDSSIGKHSLNFWLGIYALISVISVIFGGLRYLVVYDGSIRASRSLHARMIRQVLRAPLSVFDRTAIGTMINRFAKDLESVDSQTGDHIIRTTIYFLGIVVTVVTVTLVLPSFLLGALVLCIGYVWFAKLYVHTARELRRLDAVTKSPLFALYSETISGTNVLRAFGASALTMATCFQKIDQNITFFFNLWGANRWLSVRFSLLSAVAAFICAVILVYTPLIDASLAGFALSFVLNVSNDILFLVRRWTALELSMVSVERVKEYTQLDQEPPEIVEPRPAADWPQTGQITVDQLCVRYSEDLPLVLNNISMDIKGGEKIGIVGATGCGKSTLALSFFRFVEAHSGSINIDGLNIADVGLHDLRSRLSIIPQDPIIFSGTLRETLDVFDEHTDKDIYDALKRVHLLPESPSATPDQGAEINVNPFEDLDTEVSENGGNFSQGQRQLICMARALLQRNKVLLLDEATSSVDYHTDEMISKTIASEFAKQTLLVIAHRLRTIIGFDRVLVLQEGKVLEFDRPAALLNNEATAFYRLCAAAGKRELKILKKMAEGGKSKPGVVPRRKTVRRLSTRVLEGSKNDSGHHAS